MRKNKKCMGCEHCVSDKKTITIKNKGKVISMLTFLERADEVIFSKYWTAQLKAPSLSTAIQLLAAYAMANKKNLVSVPRWNLTVKETRGVRRAGFTRCHNYLVQRIEHLV